MENIKLMRFQQEKPVSEIVVAESGLARVRLELPEETLEAMARAARISGEDIRVYERMAARQLLDSMG